MTSLNWKTAAELAQAIALADLEGRSGGGDLRKDGVDDAHALAATSLAQR